MKNLVYLISLILLTNIFISCEKNDVPEKTQLQNDNRSEYFGIWNTISITLNGAEQNFSKTLILTDTTAKIEATYSSWKIENNEILFYKKIGGLVDELSYTFIILEAPNNNVMKLKHIDPNNQEYIFIFQKQQ